ncbi:MAG: NAD(P)-dependent glycerol-3-phosphate dehydrogenase [Endomicrobiales bacterium]|nr:NAD(P)-dependent glycerol-3-phosphate dehydrogenase [Endomicrobiales bacterium]
MTTVGVLGAGSWGITLANLLAQKGNNVTLWEFDPINASKLSQSRKLSFFPQATLSKEIFVTSDIFTAANSADFLLFVVPSHTLRSVAKTLKRSNANLTNTTLISAVKGIENSTLSLMTEIILDELGEKNNEQIVAISGPTHAEEVSIKIPTAAVSASKDILAAIKVQELFMTDFFRIYTQSDITGVQTAGALKNIYAIAAGMCDGLALGDNTKAALITRALREMIKLGVKMGGDTSTYLGLAGLGDLMVTCFSKYSRNRTLGEKLGRGQTLSAAEKGVLMIAEGVKTTKSAFDLAEKFGLDLPITKQIYSVLYNNKPPKDALQELMLRQAKPEELIYENF